MSPMPSGSGLANFAASSSSGTKQQMGYRNRTWRLSLQRPIFAFDISRDGREAVVLQESIAHPDSFCSAASGLLDSGAIPPKDAAR